ncbi:MAG: GNAT family N-acetyltransferase [Sedimentisphaerales bacterium]|jgi:hypothetical protein
MDKYHKTMLPDGWKIVVAKNLTEVESLRPVWEKLQKEETYPVPNADIDRFISVIEPLQDTVRPHIILLRYNGSSEAMAIGRVGMIELNCRIGYKTLFRPALKGLSIVYGGLIGKFTDNALCVLLQELRLVLSKREADVVVFNHLKIDSPIRQLVRKKTNVLCRHHFPSIEPHWQTIIPDSVELFYASIPSKHKREWGRLLRRLEAESACSVKVKCYQSAEDVDYIADVASKISARTYKHTLNIGFTDDTLTRSLLTQSAKKGWLQAYIMDIGGEPSAFEFGIRYGTTFWPEYMGYDPKWARFGPGMLLWIKVIEELCASADIHKLDYGFGDADYKKKLGTNYWPEASVLIYAPRMYPIFIDMLQSFMAAISIGLGYVLKKIGLVGWIKRNWRKMLQTKESKSV